MTEISPPTRLCCGQKHWDNICPDGQVMCQVCFSRFDIADLYRDHNGDKWDVCKECGEHDECVQCRQYVKLFRCTECSKLFCSEHWGNHDDCLM